MNKELEKRIEALKAKLKSQRNPLVIGLDEAWAKAGYVPTIKYLEGLTDEQMKELLSSCPESTIALVLSYCPESKIEKLCDLMGVEREEA